MSTKLFNHLYIFPVTVLLLFTAMSNGRAGDMPEVIIKKGTPVYSLEWKKEGVKIDDLTCAIKIDGKWVMASEFSKAKWSRKPGKRISKKADKDGKVTLYELSLIGHKKVKLLKLMIEQMEGRPYVVLGCMAVAGKDYELGGIKLLTPGSKKCFLPLKGKSKDWTVFVESIRAPNKGSIYYPYMLDDPKKSKKDIFDTGVWISTVQNDKQNKIFGFAALKGELWPTLFKWSFPKEKTDNNLVLTIQSSSEKELEKILVRAGKETICDPVLVGFWEGERPTAVLRRIGGIMGKSVRDKAPKHSDLGWSTWHSYRRSMTQEDVVTAADAMKKRMKKAGYRIIQLDGGWWITQGSYKINTNFSKGIAWLADEVHKRGLKFGLHISPFRVSPKDAFWKKHPDWILTPFGKEKIDPHDEDMITTIGAVYLDGSHPDVADHLAKQFGKMARDYKVDFMKWDHHYGALEEGRRYDPTMTGLQAMQQLRKKSWPKR